VPNAPFKKNWEEMALKRLIHHAAEKGYHGIVVTPGAEQADRYNLATHINAVNYIPSEQRLIAKNHQGQTVLDKTYAKPEDLPEYIGKELTQKLLATEPSPQPYKSAEWHTESKPINMHVLTGQNIKVGGEGMKGFYDKKVPNILNSIGKKYGVKTQLGGHKIKINEGMLEPNPGGGYTQTPPETKSLHHFPITEEMRKDVLTNGLPLYSQGGKVHMAEGGDMDQMQLAMMNKQLGMYKAANRAKAGRMAAEAIEARTRDEGIRSPWSVARKGFQEDLHHPSRPTRVGNGNIGGAAFPAISSVDPEYAGKAWGVMDTGTASRLTNLTSPETAWTTMLGSATQLKTNPIVFDKLKRQFQAAMKQGLLTPELQAAINHNLALVFGAGADIRDPKIWKMADTFEKRAALADLMMGQGITPKGGVPLGGGDGKGVIFKPTDILKQETEPGLHHPEHGGNVPTFAAGPRLFQLEKEASYRPDLHPGFPMLIHGKDLGKRIKPVRLRHICLTGTRRLKKQTQAARSPGTTIWLWVSKAKACHHKN
jgi:hypothetical protein